MIYKSKIGDIDLDKLTRLYPAALIEMYGELAEMSLEWMDMNEGKVKFLHYVLVFDFTPQGSDIRDKKVLEFDNKDDLLETMKEISKFF